LTSDRRNIVLIIAESLSQHDEKYVVPTPLNGIRVEKRRGESGVNKTYTLAIPKIILLSQLLSKIKVGMQYDLNPSNLKQPLET
jgi:hypothetical protein